MIFISRNWFMLGLLISLFLGRQFAVPLRPLAETKWLTQLIVASVMFAMALPLEFWQIRRVIRQPLAPIWASVVNLGLAPLFAWPLARLLGPELGPGLIVAAATPCTLASASVWTRKAGGNDAVAMMVTLITNAVCFAVTPMWVRVLTSGQVKPFPIAPIMLQLVLIVLMPIAAAQLLRAVPRVALGTRHFKSALGVYSQLGVLTIVMFGMVQTTFRLSQSGGPKISIGLLLICGLIVLLLHLFLFWVGWQGASRLRLPLGDQIAVGFSASQKTLMVGLSTALQLGLSAIPLVTYHILQLIADTVLVGWIKSKGSAGSKTIVDPSTG
jgi:sodium/bile acid cotransporter 7